MQNPTVFWRRDTPLCFRIGSQRIPGSGAGLARRRRRSCRSRILRVEDIMAVKKKIVHGPRGIEVRPEVGGGEEAYAPPVVTKERAPKSPIKCECGCGAESGGGGGHG